MLKESLEKLDKDVMNLFTYSLNFIQPSIEFVSQDQGYKQKNKNQQTSRQNKRKKRQHLYRWVGVILQIMTSGRRRVTQPIFLCLVINR